MKEFINEFGKENFMIILAVVAAIIFALIIIVLIERIQSKRRIKKQYMKEIKNCETFKQEPVLPEEDEEILDYEPRHEEVVYVEETNTQEEAKEKLEEVTKKLIEEDNLIKHTNFEEEQEEKSVISYDELVNASQDIDKRNDLLLSDEGEEPITIEELYKKHLDQQEETTEPEVKVSNPIFEDEKKFRNSEVISPVFGLYNSKIKSKQSEPTPEEVLTELDKTVEMKDLEIEIEKTEEFLSELKRLKNKLD